MELEEVTNEFFKENGFYVARKLLSYSEVEKLRRRADAIAGDLEAFQRRDQEKRRQFEERYGHKTTGEGRKIPDLSIYPEIRLTEAHARRGDRIYPIRERPVDKAAIEVGNASGDPFSHASASTQLAQLSYLVDNDEVFEEFAKHPKIIAILHEILSPNVKVWFDHLFSKPPYNDVPPYGGANRYHQDGFFHFSRRSVTCWIALDEITEENG